jgi:hypothetical protein
MADIGGQRNLANHMHNFASSIREAITTHGIVNDPTYGQVYAFEVDGFRSGMKSPPRCNMGAKQRQQIEWMTPISPLSSARLS